MAELRITLENLGAQGLCPVCRDHVAAQLGQAPAPPPPEPARPPDPTHNPLRAELEALAMAATGGPTGLDVLWVTREDLRIDLAGVLSQDAAGQASAATRTDQALKLGGTADALDPLWAMKPEDKIRLAALLRRPGTQAPRHGPPPPGGWPAV